MVLNLGQVLELTPQTLFTNLDNFWWGDTSNAFLIVNHESSRLRISWFGDFCGDIQDSRAVGAKTGAN